MLKFWLQLPDLIRLLVIPIGLTISLLWVLLRASKLYPETERNTRKRRILDTKTKFIPATRGHRSYVVTTYSLRRIPFFRISKKQSL